MTLLSPISTPDASSASLCASPILGLPGKRITHEGALSSPTFTLSFPLPRAEGIGKCKARGLAQVSGKNQPED
jgi:hypothetical protein